MLCKANQVFACFLHKISLILTDHLYFAKSNIWFCLNHTWFLSSIWQFLSLWNTFLPKISWNHSLLFTFFLTSCSFWVSLGGPTASSAYLLIINALHESLMLFPPVSTLSPCLILTSSIVLWHLYATDSQVYTCRPTFHPKLQIHISDCIFDFT